MSTHIPTPGALPSVDSAVADLHDLGELPLAEHVNLFDAVHTALTTALTSTEPTSHGSVDPEGGLSSDADLSHAC